MRSPDVRRSSRVSGVRLAESPKERAANQKLFIGPAIRHAPLVHHDNPVGQGEDREAMGDDQRRPPANKLSQHLMDLLLALQIHLTGRLIQDQNPRVAKDGAGEGNSLLLSPR